VRLVHAVEYGRVNDFEFSESLELRSDALRQGYVVVRRDKNVDKSGNYERLTQAVFAGGVVGLLPLTRDVTMLVKPRYPANIARMVEAVGAAGTTIDFVREYQASLPGAAEDWMLIRLCERFVQECENVMAQGLYRTYENHRETTSSPKGRILISETISRHVARNVPYKAEASYFMRSVTNPPNQALLEAVLWVREFLIGRRGRSVRQLRSRCDALLFFLQHIGRDPRHLFKWDRRVLTPTVMPSARSAYRRALPLAIALLDRQGFTLDAEKGELSLNSLLIRTDMLFEAYVRKMLATYIPDKSLSVVDGNKMPKRYLFEPVCSEDIPDGVKLLRRGNNVIQPDILIEDRAGNTLLAADVKYIGIEANEGGHADRHAIEQVITYAHRLDCTKALSIHPAQKGQRSGLSLSGRVGPTMVFNYRVNLAADNLDVEMRAMAKSIGALLY